MPTPQRKPKTRRPAKAAPAKAARKQKKPASKATARNQARTKTRTQTSAQTRTQALSLGDPVKREPLRTNSPPGNWPAGPLGFLAHLQRSMMEGQITMLKAVLALSPARLLADQQLAFWDTFTDNSSATGRKPTRRPQRKRTMPRSSP